MEFASLDVTFCFYREMQGLLQKCAETALSSKLVARHKEFFGKMVCDAVGYLDTLLPLNMIGIKKVQGGALEVGFVCFVFVHVSVLFCRLEN